MDELIAQFERAHPNARRNTRSYDLAYQGWVEQRLVEARALLAALVDEDRWFDFIEAGRCQPPATFVAFISEQFPEVEQARRWLAGEATDVPE